MIKIVENQTTGNMLEQHILELPACCPVSKNPRPGSTITISYHPHGRSLEIGSLFAYIHSFRGGLRNESDDLLVRDMEGMIQMIARECAKLLACSVTVEADLVLVPRQRMKLSMKEERAGKP